MNFSQHHLIVLAVEDILTSFEKMDFLERKLNKNAAIKALLPSAIAYVDKHRDFPLETVLETLKIAGRGIKPVNIEEAALARAKSDTDFAAFVQRNVIGAIKFKIAQKTIPTSLTPDGEENLRDLSMAWFLGELHPAPSIPREMVCKKALRFVPSFHIHEISEIFQAAFHAYENTHSLAQDFAAAGFEKAVQDASEINTILTQTPNEFVVTTQERDGVMETTGAPVEPARVGLVVEKRIKRG